VHSHNAAILIMGHNDAQSLQEAIKDAYSEAKIMIFDFSIVYVQAIALIIISLTANE
jgi:hypothetical protein